MALICLMEEVILYLADFSIFFSLRLVLPLRGSLDWSTVQKWLIGDGSQPDEAFGSPLHRESDRFKVPMRRMMARARETSAISV